MYSISDFLRLNQGGKQVMNAEKYFDVQHLPNRLVARAIGSMLQRGIDNDTVEFAVIDIFNLGLMLGTRKERMRKSHIIDKIESLCPKKGEIFRVANDEFEPFGIKMGDYVICHYGKVPFVAKRDFVIYERNNGLRMALYYGCYAKSQWALHPGKRRSHTEFIGDTCVGVISHVFSPTGDLKYCNAVSNYPKKFSLEKTIEKEPSNIGAPIKCNLTYIYDVL